MQEKDKNNLIVSLAQTIQQHELFDIHGYGETTQEIAVSISQERKHVFYWWFNENKDVVFSINNSLLVFLVDEASSELGIERLTDDEMDDVISVVSSIYKTSFTNTLQNNISKMIPPTPPKKKSFFSFFGKQE